MIELVMFDLDGLSLDTERINVVSKITEAKKYGYDLTTDIVVGGFGMCFEAASKYYENLFGKDFPYKEIRSKRFEYIYNEMLQNGLPYKKGVLELLDYLESKGIKKAIVTSSPRSYIENYKKIDESFFNKFDLIITLEDIEHGKPNGDCYRKGLKYFNVNKENALVLEDSHSGVLAGVDAGIRTIFVKDILDASDDIKKVAYKLTNSLLEVKDIVYGEIES